MTRNKALFLVAFLLLSTSLFAQQTAVYTNDLVKFNRALELYNNGQFLAAQTIFDDVKDETNDEKITSDCAYYIANAAVRLGQPGADQLMQDFVERYPTSTKRNTAFIDVADYYFENGKYSLARRWYDRVDEKGMSRKEKDRYYFNNGYAYFASKQYDDAAKYLNRVRDSKEYGSQAKYYLGYMAYEGDDYEEANTLFEEVKENDRYSENLSYFQSDMNFKLGNFQKAIDLGLEQLPTADRNEISQLNKIIGESYFNLGQYEKAIPYLKEYKGLRGKWTNTDYYQLGYAYFKQGDNESAIAEFNKIIDGNNAIAQNAYYHLAQAYLNLDQKQQALNAFKNASEMNFDAKIQEDAFLNYAKLGYQIGNSYSSPSKVLIEYLEKYPNSPVKSEMESLLIDSYITSKNYEEAMNLLENNRNFSDKVAYQKVAYLYGLELYNRGDYRNASVNFDKSLTERRDAVITAKATFWKAESDFNLNRMNEALVGYKEFAGMSGAQGTPEMENLDYNIAYSYFKQKEYNRAIDYFNRYAKNSAKDKARRNDAYTRLGDTYFVTSKYWPAMDAYNAAIDMNIGNQDYAAYQKAISYGFVNRNDSKIEDLSSFMNKYPRSSYRDDALYELGNTYVAMENTQKGIETYNRLIRDVPGSAFVPQAMLKQGLIYYNSDQSNKALERFKKVVSDYPNTPESMQAVSTARLIYIDLGRTDEYAAWVKNVDFVEVTDADLDNTTFEAAEKQYLNNNTSAAKTGFEKYLQSFPNGLNSLKSNFYLAQLYFRDDQKDKSVPHYKFVIAKPRGEFSEQALARLSQIYLEKRNYKDALPLLKRLENEADFAQNTIYAQSNLMKSYYELKDFNMAVSYAEKVLATPSIENNVKSDAQVIIARAAFETGNESRAKTAYAEVLKIATGELAAEALYYDAYFKNKAGNFKASNESVQKLAKDYSGYKLYGAKGLVIMAKNFYALKDAYQATYILDNVIKNFKEYPEVVKEAQAELSKIKAMEAKTNASVETN
ncbi:tetratricopeptide repeat protein [Gillisia sp. M10.2A]|uniref:Tetratricopeptide repeat protein n=1 Tax=Gillisia lutea TaxID=2909668 RepID=A0ABS9EIC0_9FLAO|nr:tetratricopeptide repeat protein [Gillisia lutea]MCF4102523.1 tetratricopeptide repeat protein [Gillisia lutea]